MAQSGESIQIKLDLLSQVLDGKQKFGLALVGAGLSSSHESCVAHLRDERNHTLLNVPFIPRAPNSRTGTDILQVETTDGQVLITTNTLGMLGLMTVCSSGDLIGRMNGLTALNTMNEVLFKIDYDGSSCSSCCVTEFTFTSNGVTIASVRRSDDETIDADLFISNALNSRTKALIISSALYLYIYHFAKTVRRGRIGANGLERRSSLMFLTFILTIFGTLILLVILLLTGVIPTKSE